MAVEVTNIQSISNQDMAIQRSPNHVKHKREILESPRELKLELMC